MTKKPNGHDKEAAEVQIDNPGTVRSRRHRERQRQGVIVLRDIPVAPDMVHALVQNGWLHETERSNRAAVLAAIGAVLFRALQAGVTPSEKKTLLEIEQAAIEDAWPWARPGSQLTAETAAKALETVARCAATAGFGPQVFAARLNAMVVEIQSRGVVATQELTH